MPTSEIAEQYKTVEKSEFIFTIESQQFLITNLYIAVSKYKAFIVYTFLWLSVKFRSQIPAKKCQFCICTHVAFRAKVPMAMQPEIIPPSHS